MVTMLVVVAVILFYRYDPISRMQHKPPDGYSWLVSIAAVLIAFPTVGIASALDLPWWVAALAYIFGVQCWLHQIDKEKRNSNA
jgi:hypothetical protein